ncbi:hypothetical protein [Leifsonia sp. AG29]|uniref:hypothetical protein n=1 Tax=Leifsonia sp. AG29 TaxID=2598860 RepID=UPI00131EBA46|nr:hypothetical protein [Leifsonia sp. AG29]
MSDTTPEPAEKPEPDAAEAPREEPLAPATAPAASAAAEPVASAAAEPTVATPHPDDTDTDADLSEPPSTPVSARGHVNHPAGEATAAQATVPPTPAPRQPAPAIEPEPVTASEDDVAAAVARSSAEPGATAGGSATVDTASPVEAATPVIVAAEAARLQEAPAETAPAEPERAPAAAAATGVATGAAATTAAAAAATVQPVTPIYLQHPHPPKKKSNRGLGILIALVGTVAFAALWSLAVVVVGALLTPSNEFVQALIDFYTGGPGFGIRGWAPVIAFFIGMVVLIQILNRSRWWAYILGGLVVAVFVYFVYIGASLVALQVGARSPEEMAVLLRTAWVNPFAVLAGVIAREISIWTGAWLAARGRKLKARNAEAQADYEEQVADAQNRAAAAYAGGAGY